MLANRTSLGDNLSTHLVLNLLNGLFLGDRIKESGDVQNASHDRLELPAILHKVSHILTPNVDHVFPGLAKLVANLNPEGLCQSLPRTPVLFRGLPLTYYPYPVVVHHYL